MYLYAIGSPLEQDNIAWLLVNSIQHQLTSEFPELSIEYLDRPGIQLINEIMDKQQVILVDALLTENLNDIQPLQADDLTHLSAFSSSHSFGVAETLQLSQQLKLMPRYLWILGIPITPDRNTDTAKTQRLCKQLEQHIENILKLAEVNTTQ